MSEVFKRQMERKRQRLARKAAVRIIGGVRMTKAAAVQWAGGVSRLAELLGIRPQAVSKWRGDRPIPRLREYQIAEIKKGIHKS